MKLMLNGRQARWLIGKLGHFEPNTMHLTQDNPYGDLVAKVNQPDGCYEFVIPGDESKPIIHVGV